MNTSDSHVDIAGYVAGELTPAEREAVETHLGTCAECREEVESLREMQEFLGVVPPEALLDGPPDDGDLLLQRTLRQVRTESASARNRNRLLAGAAAVVVAAAALGAGVLVGQSGHGTQEASPPSPPASSSGPPTAVPGTRFASATDPTTGARLTVGVMPAAGWVRVNASVTGIPAGQRCQLIVVGKDGTREVAGNWLVSPSAEQAGVNLDGSALIDPSDVSSVLVQNTAGKTFVEAKV